MTNNSKQIIDIQTDHLQPNPLQPRGVITPDSLEDLVDSIKKHGILEPLVVAHTPAGYQIIAGERRWRAAKLAGLENVPILIKETTPRGMLEMAIVENVQRIDLNPIDRGKAFERLMSEFNLSTTEIAGRISKSPAYVSNSLRLLKLPDALKDGLLSNLITEGHARALAAIEDTRTMVEAYKIILKESGSVRRAEELSRHMKHQSGQAPKPKASKQKKLVIDESIDKIEKEISQGLGNTSKVKLTRSRIETKLRIVLKGSLENTQSTLNKIHVALASK